MGKILLTGANGFIGRHVAEELLKTGNEIVATSIEAHSLRPENGRLKYIPADLGEQKSDWFEYFGRPDSVIHLAWAGLPNYGEMFHIEENLWNNYRFLKQLIDSGLRDITVIGTCAEYGKQEGCLSETLPSRPNNAYAVAKNSLRMFLEEYRKKVDFGFRWIRLFYMYGEGQGRNSILEQLKTALERGDKTFNMSGGEQLRDYLPVAAVATGIVKVATQNKVQGIINCGSGVPISVRNLVEDYLKRSGGEIELNFGHYPYNESEPMAFWADVGKFSGI